MGNWNYRVLVDRVSAYQVLVANQYRYYQFYGNMVVAIAFAYGALVAWHSWPSSWFTLGTLVVEWVFWMGSRDTLRNYYRRGEMLLGEAAENRPAASCTRAWWAGIDGKTG